MKKKRQKWENQKIWTENEEKEANLDAQKKKRQIFGHSRRTSTLQGLDFWTENGNIGKNGPGGAFLDGKWENWK